MALVTFCPSCNMAFRVNATQLQTHNGDVRCGSCQLVFNGFSTLITINESAIVSSGSISEIKAKIAASALPNLPVLPAQASRPTQSEQRQFTQQDALPSLQPSFQPRLQTEPEVVASLDMQSSVKQPLQPPNSESTPTQFVSPVGIDSTSHAPLQSEHLENHPVVTETLHDIFSDSMPSDKQPISYGQQAFYGFANTLLLVFLAMQVAYHYRTELTVLVPDSRPMLDRYCRLLGCSVPYPQEIEQLGIETSDLQKNETRQPVISTLSAVIRNHAPYPQILPLLQLSLLDAKDQVTANRVFAPQEYLSNENQTKQFIEAHDDLEIILNFDSNQLDAFGYRLNLLYL